MSNDKKTAPGKESSIQEKLSFIQSKFRIKKTGSGNRNAKYWKIEELKSKFASIIDEYNLDVCCYIQNQITEVLGKPFNKCIAMVEDSNGQKISVEHGAFLDYTNNGMSASMYTGSAGTYSNRYALCALFNVTDIDDKESTVDPESPNYKDKPEVVAAFKEQNKPTAPQMNFLKNLLHLLSEDEVRQVNEGTLSKNQASALISKYKN